MSWDWRREFRRQHGYWPGTIVHADHLVTAAAAPAPVRKVTPRGRSGTARKAPGIAVPPATAATAIESSGSLGASAQPTAVGRLDNKGLSPPSANPAALPPDDDDELVEVAPHRYVNRRALERLRAEGEPI